MKIIINDPVWKQIFEQPDTTFHEAAENELFQSIPEYARMAGFTQSDMEQLEKEMADVLSNPDVFHAWSLMRRTILQNGTEGGQAALRDPGFGEPVKNPYALFLLVDLAGIPGMIELYKKRGWYESTFHEALLDFKIWMDFCRDNYDGAFGLSMTGHPWIRTQLEGNVIRIGRLQCNTRCTFFSEYRIFRHKSDPSIVCPLLNQELSFNRDGMTAMGDDPVEFKSELVRENGNQITGYAVSKRGIVSPRPVTLDKSDWDEPVKAGDPVINLHIPADGPMTPELCRDSFRRMLAFFRDIEHIDPKAFTCESWLLDPMFRRILPSTSNVVAFQDAAWLLPWQGRSELVRRVFGVKAMTQGIDCVPHRTSMQRAFAEFLNAGGIPRNGAFVFFPEEI